MRDDASMAIALSTQLDNLRRERERLEELLMLDANWRALRELETRVAEGTTVPDDGSRRGELLRLLASNRLFAARAKLIETIDILSAGSAPTASGQSSLASRIVMLSEPAGETFRARLRMKPAPAPAPALEQSTVEPRRAQPDALELIDGLSRSAVEMLQEGGVSRFADIAAWTAGDAIHWRSRLHGLADNSTGSWIEQAAMLATGQATRFSERARRGEFAALVAPPPPEPPLRRGDPLPTIGEFLASVVAPPPLSNVAASAPASPKAARGYVRPSHRSKSSLDEEATEQQASGTDEIDALAAPVREAPSTTLVKRLKQLERHKRFEADEYAAYHRNIEEASVTILGREAKAAPVTPAAPAQDDTSRMTASRFFKALTGRGRLS